jgi:Holliday junction DNA helicase RuvB
VLEHNNGDEGEEVTDNFFEYIIGYYDVKRYVTMSINADEPVHILLVGPPASAKTCLSNLIQDFF